MRWWRDPWRKPRLLAAVTIGYLVWSLLPVLIAALFSFNDGRSRTSWQGFSMRWYYGDPVRSVWHDDTLQTALVQTLRLGVLTTLVCVPLGVALAIGLHRWHGRIPDGANSMLLLSFVLPETLLAVALLLVDHQPGPAVHPRHHRAGARPGHLPAVLSGHPGARAAGDHRVAAGGGGDGPRRLARCRPSVA